MLGAADIGFVGYDDILENIEKLKGKKTNNFVYIYDVDRLQDKLGIITMEVMGEHKGEIPNEFIDALEYVGLIGK